MRLPETVTTQLPVAEHQVTTPGGGRPVEFDDQAALSIVVQDFQRGSEYIAEQQYSLRWRENDLLYRSPRVTSVFEGTTVTRANVSCFTVAKHVNSIDPQIESAVFGSEDPPFLLRPRPDTSEEVIREKTELIAAFLEEMDAQTEFGLGLFSMELMGTGIWKWGDETVTKIEKRYKRKNTQVTAQTASGAIEVPTEADDEFSVIEKKVTRWRPWIEQRDVEEIIPDPGLLKPDIRKAKWICDVMYLDYYELEDLRGNPDYTLPPPAELKALFFPPEEDAPAPNSTESSTTQRGLLQTAAPRNEEASSDPLRRKLQVIERTDCDRVMAVLDQKLVIRNGENKFHRINYYSSNWWNVRRSFWGLGIGHLIGQDQRVDQGVKNSALDMLSFGVNPSYLRSRGANAPTQQIRERLGGIIDVDGDPKAAFALKPMPEVPSAAFAVLQQSSAQEESTTGANELLVQGSLPAVGRTSMGRTATGAAGLQGASASRLQGPLDRFLRQVYVPWLYTLDELIREFCPVAQIRDVLGDAMGQSYQVDMVRYLNSRTKFEALAGTKLAAKRMMAQSLPLMIQVFDNPALVQQLNELCGEYVDVGELFQMFMEVSDWKNRKDVIKKLTPEMMERLNQKLSGPGQKVQAAQAMQNQRFQQTQDLEDQRTMNRAGSRVLVEALMEAMRNQAITGEPGGPGFGGGQ